MSEQKQQLLWHSLANAPWAGTGYGAQTALFTPHLAEHYDLTISSYYGLEGAIIPWRSIPVLPGIGATYGNETILDHARVSFGELRDGLVVTLMDVWVLDPGVWSKLNTVCWVPVDHQPAPGPVVEFLRDSGAVPMAMSKFGRDELAKAGLEPLYVPHAVDCSVYRPKEGARERTGMPEEAFIVGMVAANKGNPSRKCFQEAFEAFKLLHDRHPESRLYLHTEMTGRFDGVNLGELAQAIGIPEGVLIACDQYHTLHFPFPDDVMADIYSSVDVLLAPSAGEGFGIPSIQAQACGTPVIVSDFSAQPELCGAGWLIEGTRRYTPIGAWQFRPDIPDIFDALRRAIARPPAHREEMAEKAREFAKQFHIDHVLGEQMLPVLSEAAERFEAREPVELAA